MIENKRKNIKIPSYERHNVQTGIVHIGVGNFHRAHQAFYTDMVLEEDKSYGWGICGVSLLESDRAFSNAFQKQNFEYNLTAFAPDGSYNTRRIGSILEYYFAPDDPKSVIDRLSSPNVKIVSMTITEGGYNIDEKGVFNLEETDIVHDLMHTTKPVTVFGYLTEALKRRKEARMPPFTILSCDNLQHNGNTLKKALLTFARARDPELADWIEGCVSFPNSMVDRITPAVGEEDKKRLNELNEANDQVPVFCEDFHQWVIEDNFPMGRPPWEKAGTVFTSDVSAYEHIKLRLLNGSHSMLSYPSFLIGYTHVDQAMRDPEIKTFIRQYLDLDAGPLCQKIPGMDIEEYKEKIIERFSNPAIKDQVARLCGDGISKLSVYLLDTILVLLKSGKDYSRMVFLLAAYHTYLANSKNEKKYPIHEPHLNSQDWSLITSKNPMDFLRMKAFRKLKLQNHKDFVESYVHAKERIESCGVRNTLKKINKTLSK